MKAPEPGPSNWWGAAALIALLLGQSACQQIGVADVPMYQEVGFDQVKPVLESRCLPCHQGDYLGARIPDFRTSREVYDPNRQPPLVVPGKPEESRLLDVIYLSENADTAMPPLGHGLSMEEKNLIGEWIRQGACWPDGETLESEAVLDMKQR
ncbi:MAG: hypothetical protein KDN19_11580 [Verrucomicrobiae bacterium]|nr:hypothetical protein [Verrucomicrobiae bacterium]